MKNNSTRNNLTISLICGGLALLALLAPAVATGGEWGPLCNGRDLAGWKIECREQDRNKPFWQVREGGIECNTAGERKHDYMWLVSEREFGDFEFDCLVQSFADSPGNSGIQIRSRFLGDAPQGPWMHGPQIDLHPPDPWRCGMIYDETWETRRWLVPALPNASGDPDLAAANWGWIHADGSEKRASPPAASVRKSANGGSQGRLPVIAYQEKWNRVRIIARGPLIETEINGVPITRFDGTGILDDEAHRRHQVGLRGHLALQLHSGDDLKIRFKDLRIRTLEPLTENSPVRVVRDDAQLRTALDSLRPGSVVRIAPGRYRPGVIVRDAHGTPERPILIEGLDPRSPPLFEGGKDAWCLTDVSHLQLRWIHCRGQQANGIILDDSGTSGSPSHHIILAYLKVEDSGTNGYFDGIRCTGVDQLSLRHCRIQQPPPR